MEGKGLRNAFGTALMVVLILSLVVEQTQAKKTCCQGPWGRRCYVACNLSPTVPSFVCAATCGCVQVVGNCPEGYPDDRKNYAEGDKNEYCKIGCASSMCGAITTLQNSDASEVVNGAVEQCTKACSAFCTKGSITALETSA